MKLDVKFAKGAILSKEGLNYLQIGLTPPVLENKNEKKKPTLMIFLIDRSGSMDGEIEGEKRSRESATKMDYAIDSASRFITYLSEDDKFGVVSFDNIASVEQSLVSVTKNNIHDIISNIRRITPRGMTNISDAVETAMKMIDSESRETYNCKLILLSDGQANRGLTNPDKLSSLALKCLEQKVTITSLGIGHDYDSKTMEGIATGGGGLFYHISELSKLEEIFREELSLSGRISAKNVKLRVEIPSLIEIGENMNAYAQKIEGSFIEVHLGDMYAERKVLFEIRNNFVNEDIIFNIICSYDSIDNNHHEVSLKAYLKVSDSPEELEKTEENKDVTSYAVSLIRNMALKNASSFYERGDMEASRGIFDSSLKSLEKLSSGLRISRAADDIAGLNFMSKSYEEGTLSKEDIKNNYARSYKNTRK